jgi:hypothetical protein
MSAAKRARENRRRRGGSTDPFVWLRCDALLAAACKLRPAELQVLLLLHANWRPTRPNASAGEAVLPYRDARGLTRRGGATIAAALRALRDKGEVVLVREGTRPQASGGARGEAAVYDIPRRHGGNQPSVSLPPNVKRPQGKICWNVHRLRHDVKAMSGPALKVLAFAVAHRDRSHTGEQTDRSPLRLSARGLAAVPSRMWWEMRTA